MSTPEPAISHQVVTGFRLVAWIIGLCFVISPADWQALAAGAVLCFSAAWWRS